MPTGAVTAVAGHVARRGYRRLVRWLFALAFLVAVFGGAAFGVYLWLPSPLEIGRAMAPGAEQVEGLQRTAGDFLDAVGRAIGGDG